MGKVRADTTVVSANVDYPTDLGLLAKAVRRIARIVARVKAAGAARRTRCPDHSRAAGRQALRQRTAGLRGDEGGIGDNRQPRPIAWAER